MSEINLDKVVDYKTEFSAVVEKAQISGDRLIGLCPFHDDKQASFSVDLKTGKFTCFACGEKGNYISFVAMRKGLSTKDAYKDILHTCGLTDINETAEKYTVEKYAHEKRLPEEFLQGFCDLSNGSNSKGESWVKIPYKDENGKTVLHRKRFPKNAPVRFKWGNGSSGHLVLYGKQRLPVFRENAEDNSVILVEGESDTQTLWFCGFQALGVPGASVFRPEWSKDLDGFDIYLHIEPDRGGQTFLNQMSQKLRDGNFGGKVYMWSCQQFGVKDPSDLFIQFGKDDAAKKISEGLKTASEINIFNLEESLPEAIPGAPIRLATPAGWIYDNKGIHKIDPNTHNPECVCRTPIILTRRLKSIETGEEKMEIAFKRDDKWTHAAYNRSVIFQSRSITALADLGCTITSENAKQVVKFLEALEQANYDVLNVSKSTSSFGWQREKNCFLPGHAGDIVLDVDPSFNSWVSAYSQTGTLADWIKLMKPYRDMWHAKFRFILAASFAAPLLKILKQRIFFVYNWGGSRGGKTAALKAALSAWGNPEKLMVNFNATQVALERMAGFFCDLPLGIDERQLAGQNQQGLEKIVYMLASGTGRARGSKTGGLQQLSTWQSVIMATGEEPISKSNSQTGVSTRIIEIIGGPFDNEADSAKMHQLTMENAGWAGPEYIQYLISLGDKKICEMYKPVSDEIAKLMSAYGCKNNSHAACIAAVVFADILISRLFFGETEKESHDNAILMMASAIIKDLVENEQEDVNVRAAAFISDWLNINQQCFSATVGYAYYGYFDNMTAYIVPSVFNSALEKEGFSARKTLKFLADEGVIDTELNSSGGQYKRTFTKVKWQNGRSSRYIALSLEKLEQLGKSKQ